MGFGDNKDELFANDIAAAEKALELDENNFDTQWIMCELHLMRDRLDEAEIHHEQAFSLNPNDPRIVAQRGELMTWLGRPEEGADWVRQSMRLDPFEANSRAHLLGRALFMAQQYEDAIDAYGKIRSPRFGHHAEIAACHALRGSQEDAKRHADEALRLNPNLNIADFLKGKPFRNPKHREYYKDGLRKAGLPEN